jgi:hypothetical protein
MNSDYALVKAGKGVGKRMIPLTRAEKAQAGPVVRRYADLEEPLCMKNAFRDYDSELVRIMFKNDVCA